MPAARTARIAMQARGARGRPMSVAAQPGRVSTPPLSPGILAAGTPAATARSSRPVVEWRIPVVENIVADQMIFPAHGIMQRVRAGVAPVAIEVEARPRAACATELEQPGRRKQRDIVGQHLGFGDRDRGTRDIGFVISINCSKPPHAQSNKT